MRFSRTTVAGLWLALAVWAPSGALAADDVRVTASILPQGRIDETTQIRLVITVPIGHPQIGARL